MFKDFEKNPLKPLLCAGFSGKWYAAAFPLSWNECGVVDVFFYISMWYRSKADILFVAVYDNGKKKSKILQCEMLSRLDELQLSVYYHNVKILTYTLQWCYAYNAFVLYGKENNIIFIVTNILPFDCNVYDIILENKCLNTLFFSDSCN